jgi:hypothetical protein
VPAQLAAHCDLPLLLLLLTADHHPADTHRESDITGPVHLPPPPPVIMGLDHYTRLRKLGKGSFGEVFLVQDKRDGQQYVMKVRTQARSFEAHAPADEELRSRCRLHL